MRFRGARRILEMPVVPRAHHEENRTAMSAAAALIAIRIIAVLGMLSAVASIGFIYVFTHSAWADVNMTDRDRLLWMLQWVPLLVGSLGLLFLRRWAALLVCGIGWYAVASATYTLVTMPANDPALISALLPVLFLLIVIGIITALVRVAWPHLKRGL
jgi:hypothetical protein